MTPVKGITRYCYKRSKGWLARVSWLGKTYTRMFSDGVWGDQKAAFDAAVAWRDEKEAAFGKPRSERTVQHGPGVYEAPGRGPKGAFVVVWSPSPGVLRRTSVSIARLGRGEARREAARIRATRHAVALAAPKK